MSYQHFMFAENLPIDMKTSVEIFNSNLEEKKQIASNVIFSRHFAPHESSVAPIKISTFKNGPALLMIKNNKGQSAQFSWQQNLVSTHLEKGYFKEVMNDLGVTVHYNENSITVINGGAQQFLTAEMESFNG